MMQYGSSGSAAVLATGVVAGLGLAASALPAAAHTAIAAGSHAHGAFDALAAGLAHPFTGIDHVAAMVAVGVLARSSGGRSTWGWPLVFAGLMVAGSMLARDGLGLPMVEPLIAMSVVGLGALMAAGIRVSVPVGLLVAAFGLAHGHAHGLEAPAGWFVPYAVGFASATGLLHLAGIGLADGLARVPQGKQLVQFAGGTMVALGLVLLAGQS
jgi:urease accessory protein